jgi:hypothetical protein
MFGNKGSLVDGALLPSVLRDLIQNQLNAGDSAGLRAAQASAETDPVSAQRAWAEAVCDRAGVRRANSVYAVKAIRDAYPQLSLADATAVAKSAFGG